MTKNLKLWTILLVFIAQCSVMQAENTPVHLYPQPKSKVDGTIGPSKAPARRSVIPVSVFLDETSRNLELFSSCDVYSYCIYDENAAVVLEGILDFSSSDGLFIDLSFLQSGGYAITISRGNNTYAGEFYI